MRQILFKAILLLSLIVFTQRLLLANNQNIKSDTLKVGDKIKMRFISHSRVKISQYMHWDNDVTTYYVKSKIIAIDSNNITIKKKGLQIPIDNIYKIRRMKGLPQFLLLFTVNASIGISSQFLLPAAAFLSAQTLILSILGDFILKSNWFFFSYPKKV